jgi:hypothetical protein
MKGWKIRKTGWAEMECISFPLTHTLQIEYARWIPHVIVRLSCPPEEEEEKSSAPRIDKRGGYCRNSRLSLSLFSVTVL